MAAQATSEYQSRRAPNRVQVPSRLATCPSRTSQRIPSAPAIQCQFQHRNPSRRRRPIPVSKLGRADFMARTRPEILPLRNTRSAFPA
jgi:hypothetical protein